MSDLYMQNKQDYKKFVKDIVQARKRGSLFCLTGAGTSISQGFPNWNEYVDGLIEYWSYHLEDIVDDSRTRISEPKTSDRKFLQWLKKTNYSKERKIDLVHEVISEYSQCMDPKDTLAVKEEYMHKYEQSVFIDTEPMSKENEILNELVNLRPIFITTNYDDQIEQACKLILQFTPKVYSSISDYHGEVLNTDDVLHLHGMPKSKEENFVSSSQSYLKMYNDPNEYKEQLKKLFSSVESPLLIFVGSSLQEDNVLHFLNFENVKINKYAIMLFQANESRLDNVRSEKLKNYYLHEQGIQLIWYESSFDDLPKFLHKLNEDVTQEFKAEMIVPEKKIKQKLDNGENATSDILKALKNQEFMIVDECLGTVENLAVVEGLLKDNNFLCIFKKHLDQFSKFLSNIVDNFDNFSTDIQKSLFQLTDTNQRFNSRLANIVIKITLKYWQKFSLDEKAKFLQDHISKYLNPYIDLDVKDKTVQCLRLLSIFNEPNFSYQIILAKFDQTYDFDKETYSLLQVELDKLDKSGIYYDSWAKLKDNSIIALFFNLFKKGKIRYNGRKEFPVSFYTYKIIQKILVNVDLDSDSLTKGVKEKLFSKIDWNFKWTGAEFNKFNKKYNIEPSKASDYFQNGIISEKSGTFAQIPFFKVNIEKDVKSPTELLEKLSNSINQSAKDNWKNFTEVSISGQNAELTRKMSNVKLWNKYPNSYLEIICGLFRNTKMYKAFKGTIVDLLEFGLENNLPSIDKIIEKYINFLTKYPKLAFIYPNSFALWEKIIKSEKGSKDQLYKFLFKRVRIEDLNLSVPEKDYFDISDYYHTEFFNYCYILLTVIESDSNTLLEKYLSQLIKRINLVDIRKRQIFKGMFFYKISGEDTEKYSELSLYFFANFYKSIPAKVYISYRKTIVSILKKKVTDLKTINFITASFLYHEQPGNQIISLITRSSFKQQIYNYIFTLYWDNQDKIKYIGGYVNRLISTDEFFVAEAIRKTLDYIKNDQRDKADQMINIIKSSNSVQNYKLKEEDFITYLFIIKNNSEVQLHYLVKLIGILCDKNYIIDTHEMESNLENILKVLANNNWNLEIDNLLDHVSSFIRSSKMSEWNKNYRR